MQPGMQPDDIHTILGRFNHWAGEQTANGNGHRKGVKSPGVQEIPYEEALRRVRNRKAGEAAGTVAAKPAIEDRPPVAAEKTDPMQPSATNTAVESKVRSTEKSMRGAAGRAQAKKKTARIAKAATTEPKKQPRKPERKAQAAPAQEFRQVLAKTVRQTKPAVRPAVKKEKGRDQRVSVRLSRAEEHRLQSCAAKAGVTVSEYLRVRALEGATEPAGMARRTAADAIDAEEAAIAAPVPAKAARTGLGDWLALLRNRFLASPVRFAERA
jgi:hypothetical protein